MQEEDPFAEEALTPVLKSKGEKMWWRLSVLARADGHAARSGRAIPAGSNQPTRGSGGAPAEPFMNSPKVPHEKAPEAPMLVVSGRGAKAIKRPTAANAPPRPPGPAPSPVKGRGRGVAVAAGQALDDLLALPSDGPGVTKTASTTVQPASPRKTSASTASTSSLTNSSNNNNARGSARKTSAAPAAPIDLDDDDWFT